MLTRSMLFLVLRRAVRTVSGRCDGAKPGHGYAATARFADSVLAFQESLKRRIDLLYRVQRSGVQPTHHACGQQNRFQVGAKGMPHKAVRRVVLNP